MDQGGTFTDVLTIDDAGRARLEKVLSDRADLVALAGRAGEVRRGSTVATNALLERRVARTLLITTAGFGDLPVIGDGTRPELFALDVRRPPPLSEAVLEVEGRIGADGALIAPHRVEVEALRAFVARGLRAVAVVLVHGPLRPEEERMIGARCREAGFEWVSLGHEISPSRGFLARMQTTLADAALRPLLPRAPGLYMRSDGGLAEAGEWRGCDAALSGPAGGVVAAADLAARVGTAAFGLDMGGTSTDVCRVAGAPERVDHLVIAGLTLRVPAVRLETVAAGGGSRLKIQGGVYMVGPESAGADPGPAAYGRGGPAAVTDADAVLGRLPGFPSVCGPDRDRPLDLDAARAALSALDPGRPVEQIAAGFLDVADERMAAAVRALAARLGEDPRRHALIAFGGAGPGHCCGVARRLGVTRVLVPFLAGAFSAVGVGASARRAEVVAPVRAGIAEALAQAGSALPFEGRVSARIAMRHVGTVEGIEVALDEAERRDPSLSEAALLARFHEAHRARFGFDRPGQAVEAVEARLAVEAFDARPALTFDLPPTPASWSRVWFDGWVDAPVLGVAEADGARGPALVLAPGSTVVVPPGWRALREADHLQLLDEGGAAATGSLDFHPVHTAVFASRLGSVAEQMGEHLARLARSVSIRERRDFSAAVFDPEGRLVVNAPHIPVHLGAMGETVRDLLRRRGPLLAPGQAWACNDPYAGGSHLPDITVISPVFLPGPAPALLGFVGCRGHHVDVGGSTPGSMPPDATRLDEEGLVLRQVLICEDRRFLPPDLPGCREPHTVWADLEAQVAAVASGAAALLALADQVGVEALHAQLGHLVAWARRAVSEVLARLPRGEHAAAERLDDGLTLTARLSVGAGRPVLHLGGPRHAGNLNAPRAVAMAAVLYALRCLLAEDLPLNEGALDALQMHTEPGGLLDPAWPSAVAGGNVETSQRLVDALLRALGALASSQGTMNNLTVGTSAGAFYETLGGGVGAGPGWSGASGVQVHMTNTRATDVEELERRFPVRLLRLALRPGSGGPGRWRGGDGLIKEWLFLEEAEVALLAGRRDAGAPGLAGGGAGAPGLDERFVGRWEPAPRRWRARPGDRLRISTPGGGGYGAA